MWSDDDIHHLVTGSLWMCNKFTSPFCPCNSGRCPTKLGCWSNNDGDMQIFTENFTHLHWLIQHVNFHSLLLPPTTVLRHRLPAWVILIISCCCWSPSGTPVTINWLVIYLRASNYPLNSNCSFLPFHRMSPAHGIPPPDQMVFPDSREENAPSRATLITSMQMRVMSRIQTIHDCI